MGDELGTFALAQVKTAVEKLLSEAEGKPDGKNTGSSLHHDDE